MKRWTITLSTDEVFLAEQVWKRYHLPGSNVKNADTRDDDTRKWGVIGELAVTKALNVCWSGLGGPNYADVGYFADVRTTKPGNENLILWQDDKHRPFILAHGKSKNPHIVEVVGWCWYHEGAREEFWHPKYKSGPKEGKHILSDPAFLVPCKHPVIKHPETIPVPSMVGPNYDQLFTQDEIDQLPVAQATWRETESNLRDDYGPDTVLDFE